MGRRSWKRTTWRTDDGQEGGDLVAFEHDGSLKWQRQAPWLGTASPSIALADLDADGDVEIIAGRAVADHDGTTLWVADDEVVPHASTTAADLDGDGDLEVVLGHSAYHHDGTVYYRSTLEPGYPQVANLDADPDPEILVVGPSGISVLEHTGEVKYAGRTQAGVPAAWWDRPATIHDFDGDGAAEFAASSAYQYSVFDAEATLRWTSSIDDASGLAAGTAFDFLGDGTAEAMYADQSRLFIYDGDGRIALSVPRSSWTAIEYPVVADVDDDGSAEIVVVSNAYHERQTAPTVQVIADAEDRWIAARRIWNQHAYHVTNVREDGTIPTVQPPSWRLLNTFRTNAQIEGEEACEPPLL